MSSRTFTVMTVSLALGAALGCGRNSATPPAADRTPQEAPPQKAQPAEPAAPMVTLTGCLQQGSGRDSFILTTMNEPGQPARSSASAGGNAVRREQLQEAAHAYALDAKGDLDLRPLVGRQVQVSGTVTRRSDLPTPAATSGGPDTAKESNIAAGDLARVEVTTATAVGKTCGTPRKATGRRAKHSSRSHR